MRQENPLYQNIQFSILIKERPNDDPEKFIFAEWNDFIIPHQGIYTIEGPNRSGKSILIKMIMGVLPPAIEGKNEQTVFINGANLNISKVKDAYKNGLVAVFQDDSLIPTMTIREQLYLRHASKRSFINYIYSFYFVFYTVIIKALIEHGLGLLIKPVATFIKKHEPKKEKYLPESILDPEISTWIITFDLTEDVLSKYPNQLSGGTIAKIRIISALLTKESKILFLDEALNAVAIPDCNNIIDIIKNWALQNNKTVVVVTHKLNEIFRWQPVERFCILDKKINAENSFNHDGLDSGIQLSNHFITKFRSLENSREYLKNIKRPILILIDKNIVNNPSVKDLFGILGFKGGNRDSGFFAIDIKEHSKTLDKFSKLLPSIVSYLPKVEGTIIMIGGGTLLNFGLFIAATLHRGLIEHIVVPTTLMALADVAIGSKASLNIDVDKNGISQKHILGTYANPSAVIMDAGFIAELDEKEKINGLSECLKHGIVQDLAIYTQASNLIKQHNPDSNDCFELGLKVQELKSRTLIVDPFETGFGRVLLYGHLHAHSLERLKAFDIPHGVAVYWGILLDLKLCGNQSVFNEVLNTINHTIHLKSTLKSLAISITNSSDMRSKLQSIYNSDTKVQHYVSINKFKIIKLESIAVYNSIPSKILDEVVIWDQIEKAINNLADQLV